MAQATMSLPRVTGFELRWPGIITALVIVGVVAGTLGFVLRDRQPPPVNPDQATADRLVAMFTNSASIVLADQLYTPTAVIHDPIGGEDHTGLLAIKVDALSKIAASLQFTNVTAPTRVGDVASWFMTYQFAPERTPTMFLIVTRFSGNLIAEQWVHPIT